MQWWDTAGQEKYQRLAIAYYRKAFMVFLCFDPTKLIIKHAFFYKTNVCACVVQRVFLNFFFVFFYF